VACLTVVVTHYAADFISNHEIIARQCLFPPLTHLPPLPCQKLLGWLVALGVWPSIVGVSLFFLVSGFVIPFSLQRNSLSGFFVRRFFRIYPTLWAVLLLLLTVLAFQAYRHEIVFPYSPAMIGSNALLIQGYVGHPFIEGVCWTLLVEELFYALCAVCAWQRVLDRPATVLVVALGLVGLVFACSFGLTHVGPGWQSCLYWLSKNATCAVFIFVGVVLHHVYRGVWGWRLGVPLILALVWLYALGCFRGTLGHGPEGPVLFWSALAALALFVPLLLLDRWLPYWRGLNQLAEISYPLYLAHATVGFLVIRAVYLATSRMSLAIGCAFAVVLVLAALLHRFVERPGMDLGKRLAARLARAAAERDRATRPLALPTRRAAGNVLLNRDETLARR
jgi:peptidoglycan/LPS O-acetylase OafA/YrhL